MSDHHNWGYSNDALGPDQWSKHYKTGERQSPINILVSDCNSILHSTCCTQLNTQLQDKFKDNLKISARDKQPEIKRRQHLDSTGGDYRDSSSSPLSFSSNSNTSSPSPSSSSSSSSSSYSTRPTDEDSDEYDKSQADFHNKSRQNTRKCVSNKKIFLGYPRYLNSMQLCNTGHNWQVNLPPELATHTRKSRCESSRIIRATIFRLTFFNAVLSGPPLGNREYRLAQLHCHWGQDCDHGSEHQINGKSFAAEVSRWRSDRRFESRTLN